MFRVQWLGSFLESGSSRKDRRRLAARKRKPIRLLLESLEQRLTPSGPQTVGSYTDLVNAIAADTAANTNYVMQITNSFTFDSSGQVSISKLGSGSTLTIEGQNGTNYTLTGNGNRLFTVASGQNVTFADLTLTGGSVTSSKVAQGGAILDQGGNLTLSKVIVRSNTAKGSGAAGGGVYASGAGTLAIRDSIISDNSAQANPGATGKAPGANGTSAGYAYGGGLFVTGSGWTATLIGDTVSGNTAIGGNGGNGAAGSNATAANTSGGAGGQGGYGGDAWGGAAFFSNYGSGGLTILNDPSAPLTDPSTWIDNSAQAGAGGNGGAGGNSSGTASDGAGGQGGDGARAFGGALYVYSLGAPVRIGNTAFYGNKAAGGDNGVDGLPGTGGQPLKVAPSPQSGGPADGGGLYFSADNVTIVNSTVAANTAIGGVGEYGGTEYSGYASGGGISFMGAPVRDPPSPSAPSASDTAFDLVNNTITQNTVVAAGSIGLQLPEYNGAGIFGSSNATLLNNLIQGNHGIGFSAVDLDLGGLALNYASNNFIGTMSASAASTTTNIVGNTQVQLGNVVGVDGNGNPTGGPIYYPLLPGVVSIGSGTTSVLNTIAGVEGTTAANATDAIGNLRSTNGLINLGAVEIPIPPPSAPSPPPAPPVLSPFQLMVAITIDTDALKFQDIPPALSFLNVLSEQALGLRLPATVELIPTIESDFAALVDILVGTIEGDIAALVNILRGKS